MSRKKEDKKNQGGNRDSDSLFRTLFNSFEDAVFIHDLEGNFLEVNRVAYKRLGYTKKKLLQMSLMDVNAPKYADKVKKKIEELQKKGSTFFEAVHITQKGKSIPVELSSKVIDFKGQKTVLSVARDISKRVEKEEKLRRSEKEFQEFFRNMQSGVIIYRTNEKGTKFYVEEINDSTRKMLGKKKASIVDKEVKEISPQSHQKDIVRELKRVYKSGDPSFLPRIKYFQGGEYFYFEKYIYKLPDSNRIATISRDITDKVKNQRILQESEERFRAITETAGDGIVILDNQNKIVLWNRTAEKMMGYGFEEVKNKSISNFTKSKNVKQIFNVKESDNVELTLRRKNGSAFEAEISISRSNINNTNRKILIIRDATEREKYEQKILNEQKNVEKLNHRLKAAMMAGSFAWWEIAFPSEHIVFSNNKAEMLGYSPKKFKKYSDFKKLIHSEDRDQVQQEVDDHLSGKSDIYKIDYRIKSKQGSYLWFRDVGKIVEEKKKENKVAGVSMNINEEKKREDKIKDQMEELEQMNKLMTGRELKMIELKKEIKELKNKNKNK